MRHRPTRRRFSRGAIAVAAAIVALAASAQAGPAAVGRSSQNDSSAGIKFASAVRKPPQVVTPPRVVRPNPYGNKPLPDLACALVVQIHTGRYTLPAGVNLQFWVRTIRSVHRTPELSVSLNDRVSWAPNTTHVKSIRFDPCRDWHELTWAGIDGNFPSGSPPVPWDMNTIKLEWTAPTAVLFESSGSPYYTFYAGHEHVVFLLPGPPW